jgi:hypothetical protein
MASSVPLAEHVIGRDDDGPAFACDGCKVAVHQLARPDAFDLPGKAVHLADGDRKAKLARLLARAPAGILFNEHTNEDGAVVFRHACKLGLEGIVSKRLGAPYRSGPSRDWIKVKNPDGPAMRRARAGTW